jgi:hypothetical protein
MNICRSVLAASPLLLSGLITLLGPTAAQALEAAPPVTTVYLVEGANVAPRVGSRITELLQKVPGLHLIEVATKDASKLKALSGSLVLSIGDTSITKDLISTADLTAQGSEGFIVRSKSALGVTTIATDGNSAANERTSAKTNRGVSFGAYEVLQQIGFHFNHPFTPSAPRSLIRPLSDLKVVEKPRWPSRGLHVHTMHPIELSHVLNGWGPNGPQDAAGFASELREWDLFLEWLLAHRQNQVQWVLLADKTHVTFNDSAERSNRLQRLVGMAHAWGILAGVDVGIIFEQQNMWRLLRNITTDADDSVEIRTRVKWLMHAGWDFMTVEMGSSEFTSPTDNKMLFWMNVVTDEVERVFDRYAAVKIHVTQGQNADHFTDPDTHELLNFNFLPMYADKNLTVLPHTVELYSLDDPAPTYGNSDWKEIHRFMSSQAGARRVIWYPEASYWVSYDIDTPLFLPAYAERRLHDLRLIGREEDAGLLGRGPKKGSHIQGQLLFVSGFEWGYWFNQLVAMHAAWNPRLSENDKVAFENTVREVLRPDAASAATTATLTALLSDTVKAENELLIQGKVNGKAPRQIDRMTGMAYLAGQETWDELNTTLADVLGIKKATTQPSRLGFRSLRLSIYGQGVDYVDDVHPLLNAMETTFSGLSARMIDLFAKTPRSDTNKDVLAEFADGALMNTLRATQVHALYDTTAAANMIQPPMWRAQRLATARHAVDLAVGVVARREKHYRSNTDAIWEWKANPTVYGYGYLWTVHSLQWWYRDEGSVTQEPWNVCYMNIVDPAKTVSAEGRDNAYFSWAQSLADLSGLGSITECLSPSRLEPYPRERVRTGVAFK